jgi:hypothetical protein
MTALSAAPRPASAVYLPIPVHFTRDLFARDNDAPAGVFGPSPSQLSDGDGVIQSLGKKPRPVTHDLGVDTVTCSGRA